MTHIDFFVFILTIYTLGSGQANNLEAPATEETRSMAAMDDGFASSQHGLLSA